MAPELLAALVGAGVTACAMPVLLSVLRRAQVVDRPNERSSHVRPTLRGGGVAIALGVVAAQLSTGDLTGWTAVGLVLVPSLFALLGLADDLRSLGVLIRFGLQLVLAAVAAIAVLATSEQDLLVGLVLLGVGAVWVVGYLNVFNFMDGINGISGATAALVGLSQLAVGLEIESTSVAVTGAALTGASVAFLPFNFPNASVFLGDSGSYFIGSLIAINAVFATGDGAPLVAVGAPLAIYLADASTTLLRRVRRGEQWWKPHREHVYQRVANDHLGHVRTTGLVAALTALLVGASLVALAEGAVGPVAAAVLVAVVVSLYLLLPARLGRGAARVVA